MTSASIFLVTAEHYRCPGIVRSAFAMLPAANVKAAELMNEMLVELGYQPEATADEWEAFNGTLDALYDDADAYVAVTEIDFFEDNTVTKFAETDAA